ncbi:MAG: rhomboid family intramembrane serine protease [Rhodanobacter sp.]|nr:MAG: rhomboid family intramembrane serine protease [Rhodanobacter sp.]TAL97702.1 MAG: rhomboid family intramembrane serine protease [Rhodanobacter sp.]TAM42250.1 MAG: rhomboid family intramembrane serine protease [Rhodanobacter sp.]TAN26473.1 MAG: rhomboid family intramembrane serine protease [Rhodanobacter sp.]
MPFDLPPVTRNLLIANVVVFLLQMLLHDSTSFALTQHFALWPLGPDISGTTSDGNVVTAGFRIWQLVTYAFMHGGVTHILFNMFALWMFGGAIERTFGARNFIIYYFVCAIVAALAQLLVVHWFTHGFYPTLGASGAIFGLLLAFGMMYPHEKVMLIFLPVPMPAWLFVIGYAAVELVLGVTGTQAGVAHFAHLGGMLGGIVLIEYWRGKFPIKPKRLLMR